VSCKDLEDFGNVLERLGRLLAREKARPLTDVLLGDTTWDEDSFTLAPLVAEEEGLCQSCRRQAGSLRPVRGQEIYICDRCHEDAETGRKLVKARYIAFTETAGSLPYGSFELIDSESAIPAESYLALDLDGGYGEAPHAPVVGRHLARFVPRDDDGSITEFEDIAAQSKGRRALGYLKADVDNLGFILQRGLEGDSADRRSISRLATLSRSLELFFSGHMQQLAEEFGSVYTVYAGGDDLLLVGPWDAMVGFAIRLRQDFQRYTCDNPSWSMSAGLVTVGAKTPALMAAAEAETRLDAAKHVPGREVVPWQPDWHLESDEPAQKDRLVAFGTALSWDRVAPAVDRAEALVRWLKDGALSTAQVRRLLSYAHLFQQWQRTGDVMCFRYAPMLVYDLKRNWRQAPTEAKQWTRTLTLRNSEDMPVLRFICEYALYGARSRAEGNDDR